MKKKHIIFLGILSIFIICIIWLLENPTVYNSNYWNDINLPNVHMYENVIEKRGRPLNVDFSETEAILEYDDVRLVWYNNKLNGIFNRVEILSPNVMIGPKAVCIGMKKEELEKIYDSVFIKQIKDLSDNEVGYIDGGTYIIFCFDNDNVVDKIIISSSV